MPSHKTPSRLALYLIDGSAYIYRAYFALPPLSNSKGLQTNAVYGFATMVMKILREHRPPFLAVAFDERGPTVRHETYAEYKANRPEMPQDMQTQIPYIHRMVDAFGLRQIRASGFEADDLIGTVATKAAAAGLDVVIVTGDKDMYQLLSPSVRIFDPVKEKWIGEEECRARFGVDPGRVPDVMGLMGDAIDNIPGVKGIGEKTATKLIKQYGSVEEVLSHAGELTPKLKALLTEHADQARLSRQLAVIQTDLPLEFEREGFEVKSPPAEPLAGLLRELEFFSLLKTLQPAGEGGRGTTFQVQTLHADEAEAFLGSLPADRAVGLAPVISTPGGVRGELRGLAVAAEDGRVAYVPMHEGALPNLLRRLLSGTRVKALHDSKAACLAMAGRELALAPPVFDTMIADYLLNPNRRSHGLDALALEALDHRLGMGRTSGEAEPPADLFEPSAAAEAEPAAECAAVVVRLVPSLRERLAEQEMLKIFETVEMPLVPVLAEIERNGFALDRVVLEELAKELECELDRIMDAIGRLAGETFNINSPKQLASILFDKLGLKPIRKTKTGFSTDEDTLTQLALEHDLPAQILNYRSLSKLKSTYVDALPALVNPETGRLHTSLNQTVAATGRLSSTEPNLQNIPVKGDYGLRIREAFVASSGQALLCADYSQIEPRILAHLSRDKKLLKVFEQGEDIHTATAVQIFNLIPEQITRDMRRIAKTVVFGIIYGISPYGLSQTLGIAQAEAKTYIDAYFERYSGVKRFIDRTIEEARERGYTTTMLGRRRPIPELKSGDQAQRGFGERMAVNSPIQGSAADLIKMAMIAVHDQLKDRLPRCKMILQVHDELIFEVPRAEVDEAKRLVQREMEQAGVRLGISVPLRVEMGVGPNWRAAHP